MLAGQQDINYETDPWTALRALHCTRSARTWVSRRNISIPLHISTSELRQTDASNRTHTHPPAYTYQKRHWLLWSHQVGQPCIHQQQAGVPCGHMLRIASAQGA